MRSNNIKESIKNYYFRNPTEKLRVREIERTLKLPLPSVIRYCRELEKEKILSKIKIGSINLYTANRGNLKYLLEKKLFNIKELYNSGLIEYLKIELSNPGIIVFGSYAKGEDIENSDIDLFLETDSNKKIEIKNFKKKLNREIQIIQHASLKQVSNSHLANNIINGIILNGYLEVFK